MLMRKSLSLVLAGLGAATLAGAALAASQNTHFMTVPLPDGSRARVEYVGDVPPKVTVTPGAVAQDFAPFPLLDRSAFDMQRQINAMMRQIDSMVRAPLASGPGLNVATYGNVPVQSSSTVVSTSNGDKTCTRTTEVTPQGTGKPPKVVSKVSGDCAASTGAAPEKPTA
jgi:hypothetical protein